MSNIFLLPDLGEGLTEADLVRWLVAEGDEIAVDQPVCEVETAKAIVEVPSPYAGTVLTLHGAEGQTMEVGRPLFTVGAADDAGAPAAAPAAPAASDATPGSAADADAAPAADGAVPGALSYREEERAGVQPAPDKARGGDGDVEGSDEEASGAVLIGYGTSGHKAKGRTRPSKRSRTGAPAGPARSGAAPATPGKAPRVASPIVRKLARETGVDVAAVTGTGPDGLITRADVLAASSGAADVPSAAASTGALAASAVLAGTAAEQTPAEKAVAVGAAEGQASPAAQSLSATAAQGQADARTGLSVTARTPISGVRKVIAEQLSRSRREVPEVTAWLDVDVTALLQLRAQLKKADPENAPSLLGLIARFTLAGLRRYPVMNARIEAGAGGRDEIVEVDGVHLGLAVQTPRGLMVPSVEHAERLSADELTRAINETVTRARDGKAAPAELTRGTFTLNNYGPLGTDGATPILNIPEVGMLGIGRIMDRPWVVDGEIVVRKVTEMTVTFDHRVTDGATASAFLTFVADCLNDPTAALARI
ncbi:2-oxo acid dehydrogenase subunit E2 [Micrococcus sp. EYE_162]|uniref:dihydrolipoamide acetyltransferase family protein n=1 Tax=unclassified Micrococcus TaxID=2620948 RepID=UPI002005D6A4|nr:MULTISPECIES: dihydrolipoamide acetyltransferase family protein [unclassified Micrococcus]MCK6095258.1 2-oxo acid dehydrogenase subunit E2 [Micrococcus sp. EYE_212]MCK6171205.1 2-oxo acid dehydrogenase subunit E2 [Micrococcus sp. EYE_162]